jgi:SulP family sulfate permease
VETIGTRFGGIPTGLPTFAVPHFDFGMVGVLLPSAVTVALLGAIGQQRIDLDSALR